MKKLRYETRKDGNTYLVNPNVPKLHSLLQQIRGDRELLDLEESGFIRGDERVKTMDVDLSTLYHSIQKQMDDLQESYRDYITGGILSDTLRLKKSLANLRNVAGCLFLKIVEEGDLR